MFQDFVQKFCECKVATVLQNCSLRSVITLHVVFAQNEINPGRADTRQSVSMKVIDFATTRAYRCKIFHSKKNGSTCRCYLSALAIFEFETYYYAR